MKILTIILFFILLTSFKEKDDVYIWFSHEIEINQTCNGQEVEILIDIITNSKRKIKMHSFTLDGTGFTMFNKNKAFAETDTLILTISNPIKLKVKYKLMTSQKPKTLNFKTSLEKYTNNQIKLGYGQYLISTEDIRARKEQTINATGSCQDSIKVLFPHGGSVSGATLYSDSTRTKEIKSVSYHLMEDGNFIAFTKTDIGRYFVHYSSCHWGGDFWLTIK